MTDSLPTKSRPEPWVRQFTGTPFVFRDGRIVQSCPHRHRRRGATSGEVYAKRCAERMARRADCVAG